MTTMKNARPAANGTGGEQVRQTTASVTDLPQLPHPHAGQRRKQARSRA